MIEIKCDVCGRSMPSECSFTGHPMLTIFRGDHQRLQPHFYSDNDYNLEMDLCPACAKHIRQFIFSLKDANETLKEEGKHGYEALEEKDSKQIDELREVVRDTRPGGREH